MGIHDRPYFREESTYSAGHGRPTGGGMSFGMPKAGRAVKALLIINGVTFVLQMLARGQLERGLAATTAEWWQVWRYVTFQFLHSTRDFWHIVMNMLCLYMLGSVLERTWGQKRFLAFYLSSGAVAGVAYVVMGRALGLGGYLIGASGGVYAILLACAVLFPTFRIILLFFPVPIRLAVTIFFGVMILTVLRTLGGGGITPAFWSQVAHFGGALSGAFWIWVLPRLQGTAGQVRARINQGAWDKKVHREATEQKTIDEILRKVHDQGINSLTRQEKNTLADATKREQRGRS